MHWTDKFITYNPGSQRYIAYDETGEELKRFYTKEAAKIYLINYAKAMDESILGDHNLR